jgi:hypothetical protein
LLIIVDGGGVGGVDISIICSDVDIEFVEGNNGGDVEGEGGRGSISVFNA